MEPCVTKQPPSTTGWILQRCLELGFARAGVADARPTDHADVFRKWLAAGRHGEMEYLNNHADIAVDPSRLLPGVTSIICVADRLPNVHRTHEGAGGRGGRIARYAQGDDYHRVIRKRLHHLCDELAERHPDESFRSCVDTAPIFEREHAERAGLGAVGKHTLIIERGVGSHLLLGEIVTTLALEATPPATPDPCGSCTRCIDACPTDAITPFSVDGSRCVSYLTIEHRSAIDESFHEAMGDWIFGCDICQDVCPHNQPTDRSAAAASHEAYAPKRTGFDLLAVLDWSEEDRREAFAKSAMKRAKLWMMKRNALIAAGNRLKTTRDDALLRRVEALAHDESEHDVVRETACAVLDRLGDQSGS
jgi:epoxyqueuosine reductase